MTTNTVATLTVAEYRKKFLTRFARYIKSGKKFTADDFRNLGHVDPKYVGGIWKTALAKHVGKYTVVGRRNSTTPSRKGSSLPIYQGV